MVHNLFTYSGELLRTSFVAELASQCVVSNKYRRIRVGKPMYFLSALSPRTSSSVVALESVFMRIWQTPNQGVWFEHMLGSR